MCTIRVVYVVNHSCMITITVTDFTDNDRVLVNDRVLDGDPTRVICSNIDFLFQDLDCLTKIYGSLPSLQKKPNLPDSI